MPFAIRELGIDIDEAERQLTREAGLLGVSGVSNDIRDICEAAGSGNDDARLALDLLVHSIRHWIGAMLVELGGLDALVFTAGIGEHRVELREQVCAGLERFGVAIDADKNAACSGEQADISRDDSPAKVLVIPANEEVVLAREVYRKVAA